MNIPIETKEDVRLYYETCKGKYVRKCLQCETVIDEPLKITTKGLKNQDEQLFKFCSPECRSKWDLDT